MEEMTVSEYCLKFKVPRGTVYRWIHEGKIQWTTHSGHYFIVVDWDEEERNGDNEFIEFLMKAMGMTK